MAGSNIWRKSRRRWLFAFVIILSTVTSHSQLSNHINIDDIDNDEDVSTTTEVIFEQLITLTSPTISPAIPRKLKTSSSSLTTITTTKAPLLTTTTIATALTTHLPTLIDSEIISSSSASATSHLFEESYQFNFTYPIYNATIPENSVQKTFVVQPYSDKARMGIQLYDDGMHNIDVKYQIIGGDKNKVFKAEERVVGDFAFLTIRTRTNNIVLNREKGDSYRLRVKATVSRSRIGTKKRFIDEAETFVDIKVLDKNDLSPLFYPTKYSITITDDTPLHQSILRVTAEDADIGINGGKSQTRVCCYLLKSRRPKNIRK
jgi:hypothetical protein